MGLWAVLGVWTSRREVFFFSPLVISGVFVMTLKKKMNKWVSPPKFFIHYIVDQRVLQTKQPPKSTLPNVIKPPCPSLCLTTQVAFRIILMVVYSCDYSCHLGCVKRHVSLLICIGSWFVLAINMMTTDSESFSFQLSWMSPQVSVSSCYWDTV